MGGCACRGKVETLGLLRIIVPVFHIVVFEAMEMWVMGCLNEAEGNAASGGHAFSLVHGGWRKGWWESARGEGCQKAMDIRDSGKR